MLYIFLDIIFLSRLIGGQSLYLDIRKYQPKQIKQYNFTAKLKEQENVETLASSGYSLDF